MSLPVFKLEDYLSHYEFTAPLLLCCSDAESFSQKQILEMANAKEQALWDNLHLGYTEAPGHPALRAMIRQTFYPSLNKDNQILTFSGAEEGIFCALFALCEPEDHVIVLTPCYQSLLEVPKFRGAKITQVALREKNEWRIDIDEIKRALKSSTKVIVMNFPHNPTGQVIDEEELRGLVELCRKHDLWLFSDEVYRLLGEPQRGWSSSAAVVYEKALSLGVMSKAFGLAGLRLGWIACHDEKTLLKIQQVKHYLSICCSAPSEILSLIALRNYEAILARNNEIVAHNLNKIDEFMRQFSDLFSWVRPQGGCVGFMHYHNEQPIEVLAQAVLKKAGVLLMPAAIYDVKSNHFRIGFGRKNLPEALDAFAGFLRP